MGMWQGLNVRREAGAVHSARSSFHDQAGGATTPHHDACTSTQIHPERGTLGAEHSLFVPLQHFTVVVPNFNE